MISKFKTTIVTHKWSGALSQKEKMHQTYVDDVASVALINDFCEMKPHLWQYNAIDNENKTT